MFLSGVLLILISLLHQFFTFSQLEVGTFHFLQTQLKVFPLLVYHDTGSGRNIFHLLYQSLELNQF